ncbi:MAG: hypothetical protein DWP97_05065 [Calditrichaeota bacterium]|nr:MAG: hypothetical protein DWP97_05065 [Calditrichota bacterium]
MSKMQVSECDDKIYVLWTQHLDPPNGVFDDCAARADGGNGDAVGATNGELFISVSTDYGLTWDAPRNITNSFSGGCDPSNGGADCESDMWPSMASHGRQNNPGEDWLSAEIVDPTGSYAGDYFLDVQYINDKDAGSTVKQEGTWRLSPVKWFRIACIEPTPSIPNFIYPNYVGFPTWAKPGESITIPLTIENNGNVDLIYSISVEMDNNPGMNWLSVFGLSGMTPSGLANVEDGLIGLGSGTTTIGGYNGRIIFTSNAPSSPDTLPVYFTVADTVIAPVYDTIESACLALAVSNTGNYGNNGRGGVNMDWVFSGAECDTTGAADVYLYDGSPVISWIDGVDTVAYWSIFGDGWLSSNGFKPAGLDSDAPYSGTGGIGAYNWYTSGKFVTPDSTIGMKKTWIASTNAGNCDFIIQKLSVWSEDGTAKSGIAIGEAIDWDIPSDSGAQNTDGFSPIPNLIYQTGAEYNVDTVCQDSDNRHGGVAFFESYLNGSLTHTAPFGAYTGRNDLLVFPADNFVPSELYENMQNFGFTTTGQTTDLHTVMTFNNSLSLGATDTVDYWIVLATVQDGTVADLQTAIADGKAFITANNYFPDAGNYPCPADCVGIRGNVDTDPADAIDIADLVYLVDYSFNGGPAPATSEADVDASGGLDIADIVYLVNYMFAGGPAPLPCC